MKTSEDTIKVELYNRGCGNLKRAKWFNIASSSLSLFLTQPHFINSIGHTGLNFRTRPVIKREELQKKSQYFTVCRGARGKLRETFCFRQPLSELKLQQRTRRDTDNGKSLISVRIVLFR